MLYSTLTLDTTPNLSNLAHLMVHNLLCNYSLWLHFSSNPWATPTYWCTTLHHTGPLPPLHDKINIKIGNILICSILVLKIKFGMDCQFPEFHKLTSDIKWFTVNRKCLKARCQFYSRQAAKKRLLNKLND